jgi:xanthine dehydrogenase FAD-binding subunit
VNEFAYLRPDQLAEALGALTQGGEGARVLAGGTDLLVELRKPDSSPLKVLVDISRISALGGVRVQDGAIHIGPLTTHDELVRSGLLREHLPVLAEAASWIGSPQIRNRGTIGGNIMNAATCADTVPPLVALGASVVLSSSAHSRHVPISSLFLKPYLTCATRQEILTDIVIPMPGEAVRGAFIKLGRRNALSISRLSVAVMVRMDSAGRIVEARIVPGAAFPVWRRISGAEKLLVGQTPTAPLFAAAGRAVAEEMIAVTGRRWSTEYKEPVIAVLVRRALQRCAGMDEYATV